MKRRLLVALAVTLVVEPAMASSDIFDRVEHGHAASGGVKIHYPAWAKGRWWL